METEDDGFLGKEARYLNALLVSLAAPVAIA